MLVTSSLVTGCSMLDIRDSKSKWIIVWTLGFSATSVSTIRGQSCEEDIDVQLMESGNYTVSITF